MRRVLEAIFRHSLQLFALLVVLPIIGLAVAYALPRSYQANASLWAVRRYAIIGATGPEADLTATPAETQVTALSELLQSRTFALAVAQEAHLASTLDPAVQADPVSRNDALFTEISHHVLVIAQGYNLFTISYTNHSPGMTVQVINAVIYQYGLQGQHFSVAEGQRLLISYESQLTQAKQAASSAAAAETQYLTAHPNLNRNDLQADPQYSLLHTQTQQAQATVANIQNTIDTINQAIGSQGTTAASLFNVIDTPVMPVKPVSRIKELLIGGGIGLGVAMLAYGVYILVVVRRNHAVYTPPDLQKVTDFPVVLQLPLLSAPSIRLLALPAEHTATAGENGVATRSRES